MKNYQQLLRLQSVSFLGLDRFYDGSYTLGFLKIALFLYLIHTGWSLYKNLKAIEGTSPSAEDRKEIQDSILFFFNMCIVVTIVTAFDPCTTLYKLLTQKSPQKLMLLGKTSFDYKNTGVVSIFWSIIMVTFNMRNIYNSTMLKKQMEFILNSTEKEDFSELTALMDQEFNYISN